MAIETERKFLVTSHSYRELASESRHLVQGYLSVTPEATVRVRIVDDRRAVITVKGRAPEGHFAHGEWEYEVPVNDAQDMLELCGERVVDKTRHIVEAADGKVWEVDEFGGRHQGLVIAEVELEDECSEFVKPGFVGEEVTGNPLYYNSHLASIDG